jgi:hypothetical protein
MTTATKLDPTVDGIVDQIESKGYKKCSLCGEEWSKLIYCEFFDSGEKRSASICVRCSEYPSSFYRFRFMSPFPGIQMSLKRHRAFWKIPEEDLYKTQCYVEVKYSGMQFNVSSTETWVAVENVAKKATNYFPNNFQAWSFIIGKLVNGDDVEKKEEASWH